MDIGSTTTKVAVADGSRWVSAPTPSDPAKLVALVLRLIAEIDVVPAAIGIASMAETGVPLDRRGDPMTELLRWDAARADRPPRLFERTGVPSTPKPPLVTWLRRELRFHRWAGVADLVGLALTGSLVTDHTLAGRTMAYRLPPAGEPLDREFDAELLGLADLTPRQLPAVSLPGDPPLRAIGSAGIPPGTPVVIAGHDHAVGAWGAGVRASGDAADSVGTTEAVITVLDGAADRAAVERTGMSLVRTIEGDREAILGGAAAGGAMIQHWADLEYGGSIAAMLAELPVDARHEPTVVLPYPRGRQCPDPEPGATLRVVRPEGASRPQRAAALLDALAFHARWMLDVQAELAGRTAGDVVAFGGPLVANRPWLHAKAGVMPNLRLVQLDQPVAAAAGLLAAVRAGLADPRTTLPSMPVEPQSSLEAGYRRFLAEVRSESP